MFIQPTATADQPHSAAQTGFETRDGINDSTISTSRGVPGSTDFIELVGKFPTVFFR